MKCGEQSTSTVKRFMFFWMLQPKQAYVREGEISCEISCEISPKNKILDMRSSSISISFMVKPS